MRQTQNSLPLLLLQRHFCCRPDFLHRSHQLAISLLHSQSQHEAQIVFLRQNPQHAAWNDLLLLRLRLLRLPHSNPQSLIPWTCFRCQAFVWIQSKGEVCTCVSLGILTRRSKDSPGLILQFPFDFLWVAESSSDASCASVCSSLSLFETLLTSLSFSSVKGLRPSELYLLDIC